MKKLIFLCKLTMYSLLFASLVGSTASAHLWAQERDASPTYGEALQNFRQQRLREASRQLKAILQKDPRHKEALLLLGTLYYQNQSFRKARMYFERSDVSALSIDTAFAYASVYFHFEDYRKAILGYRYVLKSRGPFRNFAIYYLGVCYYKTGQWSRARRFFQNVDARDLPPFMRSNRKAYLAEIRKQQDRLLASVIGSSLNQTLRQPTAVEQFEASLAKNKEKETEEILMSEEEFETPRIDIRSPDRLEAPRGFVSSWQPSVQLLQETSYLDNHGLTHDSVSLMAHREAVQTTMGYNHADWNSYLRLQAGLQGYQAAIQETLLFQLEQSTGTFTSENNRRQKLDSGFAHVELAGSINLGQSFRLESSASYLALLPRYDSKLMWGEAAGSVNLGMALSDLEANLQVKASMPFDQVAQQSAQDLEVQLEGEKVLGDFRLGLSAYQWLTQKPSYISKDRFRYILLEPKLRYRVGYQSELGAAGVLSYSWGDASLSLRASLSQRESKDGKPLPRISKLDSMETVALGASQLALLVQVPIWESFALSGSASLQQLTAYLFRDTDENGAVLKEYEADVQQAILQMGVSMSLTNWMNFSGRYQVSNQEFSGENVQDREFRRRNPDLNEDSVLLLELTRTF